MRSSGLRWGVAVMSLAAAAVLAACAQLGAEPAAPPSSPPPTSPPAPSPSRARLLVASATVLDAGRGPELCVGAVFQSYPPQCGGPPVDGWTWPKQGVERAGRTTWGSFFVVGTYDGRRFAFDRLVSQEQASKSLPRPDEPDFASPCLEPAGGWRAPDASRSTSEDQQKVIALAEKLPGYAELWLDDRGDPQQNPLTTVINVQVTGSVAEAEARLRTVWGGPLCVSSAAHSKKELERVRDQLSDEPGLLTSSTSRGVVTLGVVYDDGTLQRRYDQRFGAGLVRVESALRPYVG